MKTRIPMKLLAALTALCLLLGLGVFSAMAEPTSAGGEDAGLQAMSTDTELALASGLHFDGVGSEFKILVMGDLDDGALPYPTMLKYIEYVLEDVEPDLIVLNGDITREGASMFGFTSSAIPWVCDLFGDIPFTVTFGENDALLAISKNNYFKTYQKYDNCLAYDMDREALPGVANHNLFIFNDADAAADAEEDLFGVACNLWLLDSNGNGIRQPQTAWYAIREDSFATRTEYKIPSMLFTHFPLPEAYGAGGPAAGLVNPNYPLSTSPVDHRMSTIMGAFGLNIAAVSSHHRATAFNTTFAGINFIGSPGLSFLSGSGTSRATRGATLITLKLVSEGVAYAPAIPAVIEPATDGEWVGGGEPGAEWIEYDEAFWSGGEEGVGVLITPVPEGGYWDDAEWVPGTEEVEIAPAEPAIPAQSPVVIISGYQLMTVHDYFNDDNPAEECKFKIGSRNAFYKAGSSMAFGPIASLFGVIASVFGADKYAVTYSVTQFFGDTFHWILG